MISLCTNWPASSNEKTYAFALLNYSASCYFIKNKVNWIKHPTGTFIGWHFLRFWTRQQLIASIEIRTSLSRSFTLRKLKSSTVFTEERPSSPFSCLPAAEAIAICDFRVASKALLTSFVYENQRNIRSPIEFMNLNNWKVAYNINVWGISLSNGQVLRISYILCLTFWFELSNGMNWSIPVPFHMDTMSME